MWIAITAVVPYAFFHVSSWKRMRPSLGGVEDGGGECVLGMKLCFLGVMEHCVFSVWGCCCLSCLTAVRGVGVSLLLREQPEILRIWIGSGESMSEKRGWGNSGGQPRERCPPAHLLGPLPTVFVMSPSPWPPPLPPESNSPVSGVGELVGECHPCCLLETKTID